MKKFICFILFLFLPTIVFSGCDNEKDILRIHIRANSNIACDQEVKLKVRDNVIEYITPLIAECYDCDSVKNILSRNLCEIEIIAKDILLTNGFDYGVSAEINNEYFPSRDYDGRTFSADYYDALIIKLGEGKGDNWWCVAYPPLCFVGESCGDNIQYKSKIVEMISKFFGG